MCNWLVNVCVILVLFLNVSVCVLNPNSEGVCSAKVSIPRTRYKFVTYTTNKWCGKRKCIGRKKVRENYKVTTTQTICCNGWQYSTTNDTCSPLCTTGCNGGRCIAPNICQCDPPMTLDEHNNTCILSTCDLPCYKAECRSNKCECFANHTPYNSTHCKQICEAGYQIDENLNCVATCEPNCGHGHCVAPNQCACDEGYILKDGVCDFNCEPECVNSVCVGVNTCRCIDGFVMTNVSYKCGPRSPPNEIPRCSEGFELVNGGCTPICVNKCVNGVCVARNTCKCNDGYVLEGNSSNYCFDPCSQLCDGSCDGHGNCYSDAECTKIQM